MTDLSYAVTSAFYCGRLVLASSTYDGGLFPPMKAFLEHLQAKGFRSRRVGLMENGSWAPAAARLMRMRGIGALPVCEDDGTLAGMLTDRDIVVRCVSSGDDPGAVTVRSIMSRDPVTVEAGADIRRAMETMRAAQVRRLPVTEGGKLAGILSIDDIARSGRWDMECAQALCGITANICRR